MFLFLTRYWWLLVARGAMAILFGVLAFTLPEASLAALMLVFGAYAFADGGLAIMTTLAGRDGRGMAPDSWIVLLHGLSGVAIGILTLFNPAVTAVALLFYVAAWAIAAGMLQIFTAVKLRHDLVDEWWLAFGGVLGVLFGIAMMWRPALGAVAVLWVIASYAVVWGVMLVAGGFEVRRAGRHAAAA